MLCLQLEGGRKRVKFLPQHITILEDLFLQSQYPTTEVREKLEQQLGVSENRILVRLLNLQIKQTDNEIINISIHRFGSKTAELRKREKQRDS